MDWVHRGGPWTGSTEVVHGLGPQGWSMDPGPCFVYVRICVGESIVETIGYVFTGTVLAHSTP